MFADASEARTTLQTAFFRRRQVRSSHHHKIHITAAPAPRRTKLAQLHATMADSDGVFVSVPMDAGNTASSEQDPFDAALAEREAAQQQLEAHRTHQLGADTANEAKASHQPVVTSGNLSDDGDEDFSQAVGSPSTAHDGAVRLVRTAQGTVLDHVPTQVWILAGAFALALIIGIIVAASASSHGDTPVQPYDDTSLVGAHMVACSVGGRLIICRRCLVSPTMTVQSRFMPAHPLSTVTTTCRGSFALGSTTS